ncbi:MAG: type 1 glutamine amidotransferase [Phycisphaerae bacterium]|jgi:GMP synthase (glutamine-hydrolysing)|nr:type 1 glutamine amidotransferase [Phycisphaerae bacterium]
MPILIIEHSNLTGSERLGTRLREDGHKLQIIRVYLGEQLPENLDEIDGVISCGGPQAPDCNEEWLEQELSLLREADSLQIPVLGICLGSQLLARALGGTVSKSASMERGWYDLTLTPTGREDILLAGQPWVGPQLCWHSWEVTELPEGAIVLATTERCNIQAWMKGISTYAVQFHPECKQDTITAWIADEDCDSDFDGSAIETDTEKLFSDYERLTNRFFDAISQLLMPVHTRLQRQRH